jgi:transcriptional regulator with XRE-family HTH domain
MHDAKHRLVAWRKGQGLTQREAAALAGVSQAAWNGYEDSSSTSCPGINAALNIARITDGTVPVEAWREADVAKAVRKARAASKRVRRAS